MVQSTASDGTFPRPRLFQAKETPMVRFPIQRVEIDWGRQQAKRALVLDTVDQMPGYLLYPEVLALKPTSFIDDGYDFGVVLTNLKQKAGRPSKAVLARSVQHQCVYLSAQFCRAFVITCAAVKGGESIAWASLGGQHEDL